MSFKYISKDTTAQTAGDAETLSSLDIGKLFPGNDFFTSFRIGNTSNSGITYDMSGVSDNSGILSSFFISYGNEDNYEVINSGISIPNLGPNQISEEIFIKFDAPSSSVTVGEGTIRILTTES